MGSKQINARRERQERRNQAMRRYEDNKKRNVLATPGVHDFVLVLDHLKAGFNVPKIFRSGEAFGVAAIHLVNIGPFDPAPAKGAFRKVPAKFHDNFDACYQQLINEGFTLYALAPEQSCDLANTTLASKSAFIFGHEEQGLSFELEQYPDIQAMHIEQFGHTQSLNVSVAASIVMYEYSRQQP